MGVGRVGRPGDALEMEIDPFDPAEVGELVVHRADGFNAAELAFQICRAGDASRRDGRIEAERLPADREIEIGEHLDGMVEPMLAEIAPRADDVGDHVDREGSRSYWGTRHQVSSLAPVIAGCSGCWIVSQRAIH